MGTTLQIVGETLCEALDLRAGERVLDIAAGNGNATLAAARHWADVTSTDYVAALLECGRVRASAEGLAVRFNLLRRHLPAPAGVRSPALWGTEERLRELFGDRLDAIAIERRDFVFRYRSAAHWLEVFRTFYGPIVKAFGALDGAKQESLAADLIAPAERFNRAADGTLVAPGPVRGGRHQAQVIDQ